MKDLVDWFNRSVEEESNHPLILIGIFIVVFLAITRSRRQWQASRVLTTLLLLRAGYGYVPYSSMEGVIEQNKDSYYLALRRTQQPSARRSRMGSWLVFFLKNHGEAKRQPGRKVKEEQALRSSLQRYLAILELAKTRDEITVKKSRIRPEQTAIPSSAREEAGGATLSAAGR